MDEIYEGQEMTFEGAMGGKGLRAEEVIAG
jgi:cold shock CspA family protein